MSPAELHRSDVALLRAVVAHERRLRAELEADVARLTAELLLARTQRDEALAEALRAEARLSDAAGLVSELQAQVEQLAEVYARESVLALDEARALRRKVAEREELARGPEPRPEPERPVVVERGAVSLCTEPGPRGLL